MPLFELDALLAPVDEDQPCGPDLEGEPEYAALELLAHPTPERMVRVRDPSSGREVSKIIEGREADPHAVLAAALALLARSRDLRVTMLLLPAATRVAGLAGYADTVRLMLGLCRQHWSSVHPQLDPEDEFDPTMRLNILAACADAQYGLLALRAAPLAEARAVGRFTLRDLEAAAGDRGAGTGQPGVTRESLLAACQQGDQQELAARLAHASAALADLAALEALLQQETGRAPEVALARRLLQQAVALYREAAGAGSDSAEGQAAEDGAAAPLNRAGTPASRADAQRLLVQACEFLERAEPAHPAPLLVRRAIRLLDMNFLQIMQDLTPQSVAEIERLGGPGRS
ncbi:type VI secretion system protein TssA [Massilia horti]|uniref:Type VI secretion system protein TssA n=1 Tax=Massilia horti TaxID=2562153 RepID=A0A4Y9T2Z9_9BURK|nr:type VI secretion system protein TssA [Massilia horti]TFW33907.1 type VI secretion system protein TssA [Massilia horti]